MKQIDSVAKFDSLSELNKVLGLPKPLHPLVSMVNYADMTTPFDEQPRAFLLNFYKISYKLNLQGKIGYGQNYYDFNEGRMAFIAPNQILARGEMDRDLSGYTLLFHPDLILNYPLASKIRNYSFFLYTANEALYLSDKEKQIVFQIFDNIREELNGSIDDSTQDVLVSQIELLLNYSNRFYKRQFITRKAVNNDLLTKMESILNAYFKQKETTNSGLPTVEFIAEKLNVSPRYLSDMLRSLTGQNTQQHIHNKLIEVAKEYLVVSELSVSEIAFQLGFEHSQSFSKLFKKRTNMTPLAFKQSFN
ncbi:helix-turn-helix domain-containing protein [Arcicella lustrica]|uniref:Helix-turn-helix transcriptional regulator n=1 Tax=Arcicella lustrica TaxID=2984196 RepID=A0ABU5SS39_9BACT|nr:helix-turn-helix transcriptional regulator [Arcicella sp. DC25W]MEA5429714.1 helix-turn-helix transcriptional regulator [Arcicella sp. DC25W]